MTEQNLLLVHCWVSGAAHGACALVRLFLCGVGVWCVGGCSWWLTACWLAWLCWLVVVGVVCENCIVDASILFFCLCVFCLCVGFFVCVFVVQGRMVDALAC